MYSRVVRVTKEIVKKGISVGICLAMLLPILPLNFSFIMNTEKEAKAGLATAPDHCTSKANANSWAYSDLRAWLNNALATSVPDSGTAAPTGKNYKLDSTATSDNTSGYAKSAFPDNESWSELAPITRFISDGKGSYHKLTDKVVIPHSGGSDSNMILKIQPEGIDKGTYSVPWKDTSYSDKHMTCTPSSSDATKISGFNGFGEAQDIAVSDNGYVNPIIDLSDMSQIVCAPTLAELQSNGGTITKNLTKDSASSSARMCFYRNEDGLGYFANISIDENDRVGFGLGMRYKTCVAMAMKKNGNNIEIITSSSNVFDEGIRGYWIDFGKTKEELKEYVFYAWQEAGGDKYASAGYMTGAYWNGDSLKADSGKGSASALDGFKGIVYGNTMVGYQGTVPFGNRTWRYLGNDYFVQEQPENVIFNASTDGYSTTQTEINLSDELRNGIELTTTGSPVEIPTDGISLTGFPANAPISFQYYYADIWRDGTPKAAGSYYVIVCVWSEGFEPKYSPAFPLTVEEIPVPKYTAPTKKIDAIWRDKAKDKLPSALADHFGYPKTASGANIPGTWALVDENAEVGNATAAGAVNEILATFTPDPSVLDTYNWAGLRWWDANESKLKVPALFTVAPMPADRISCGQIGGYGQTYDGTPKGWSIKAWETARGAAYDNVGYENYDVVWPEDMTNAGTKTYTVNLKNNCTGTLTGTVEISKRKIKITADNQTINYGEQLPQLTWQQSGHGFVLSDSLIEGSVAVEESGNYPGPGEYNIVPSGFSTSDLTNYELSLVNGKLTINGPSADNVTMSLNQSSFPFNGRRQNLIVTVKDGNDILKENVHYALNVIGDLINVGQGRAEVTLQAPYETRTLKKDWSITKRDVNVKIDDKYKVQGENDPTFTYTVTAVDNGEVIDGVDLALTRDSGEDLGGSYTIRLASTSNSNVNIVNTTNGTLKIGTDTFEITPRDISNATVTVTPASSAYTGGVHTPDVVLTDILNGVTKTLTLNTDYTLTWPSDMTNMANKTITAVGQGNYTGSKNAAYEITAATIKDSDVTLSYNSVTYDGNAHPQTPTVTVGGRRLTVGTDYTVSGDINPTNVSDSYKITIAGQGNYQGNVEKTFAITVASSDDGNISAELANAEVTYNGEDQKVGVTVKEKVGSGTRPLQENVDYTKSYTDASGGNDLTNVGTKTVTITLQGNYSGTLTKTYKITQRDITSDSDFVVTVSPTSSVYTGVAHTPTLTAKYKNVLLTEGSNRDFIKNVSGNLRDKGEHTYTVTGQGNFTGSKTVKYTITRKAVSDSTTDSKLGVTTGPTTFTYNGSPQKLDVQITYNGETWQENVDYTKSYTDASGGNDITNQGTKTLRVTFIKNLDGTITKTYTITAAPITASDVALSYENVTYDGNAHPQTPTVTVGGRRLTVNTDYTVSGDTNPTDVSNSYKITIAGQGNYSGTVTKTFAINKKEVTDSKPNGITMSVKPVEGKVFNGQRQTPDEVILKDGAKLLIEHVDYDLEYLTNMTDAITHKIKANLKGNYSGSKTADFIIKPKQISDNTPESELKVDVDKTGYTDETGYTYDKTPKKPAVTIKAMFGNRTMQLVQGTHFDVNYLAESGTDPSDVTNVGPKKVVITFKKDFSGTKTIKYAINRRDVTIRANERRRYYKTPDPDMRPRTNYDTINGLIAGDNLYGSFEREDPTNEEVGRYKIIQGRTLTNANNPNYNIIFDAENSGYFIIEVDKSGWGTPQDYPPDHYVDDEGTTSVEIKDRGITWLKEEFKEGSIDKSVWFGLDNALGIFRIGSRFSVALHNDLKDVDDINKIEDDNYHRFDVHVTDPDGVRYEDLSTYFKNLEIPDEIAPEVLEAAKKKAVVLYVQYEDDWDSEELVSACTVVGADENIPTVNVGKKECPEGLIQCAAQFHRHFSPFIMYDEFTDEERRALEGNNDDETNVLRTTVDIKGKTVQIIVSGPRRVLPEGTRLIADIYPSDNTCKIWLLDENKNELPRPLSERVEVFIEMVDGMEDLIEVRLPKIGEDFHYGKFDGSWYGAVYTTYFPISLSLDELTDAERDELNKKRGLSGDKESDSDGGSSSSRNGSNAENDGQGDNETEELQPAENGSSNWWQNLSRTQIICLTAAGILLLLLLIFLILLILKRRKEKENSSQQ